MNVKAYLLLSLIFCSPLSFAADNNQNSDSEKKIQGLDQIDPIDDFKAHFNKANKYLREGNSDDAIIYYKKSIQMRSDIPQSYFNLGLAFDHTKNYEEAVENFKLAVHYNEQYTKAWLYLGTTLKKQEEYEEAETAVRKSLEQNPTYQDAQLELARILNLRNKFKESVKYYEIVLKKQPENASLMMQLGNTLNMDNQTEKALDAYMSLHQLRPQDNSVRYNIAYTLKKLGRLDEAFEWYEKVLESDPLHASAHFSRGLAYLAVGDFEHGWPEYEWRWKRSGSKERKLSKPQWDGSPLDGRTILLHAEQGLGDSFQFIRYAKVVKDMGPCKVMMAVQRPMQDIAKMCPYIDKVISLHEGIPHYDVHVPIMTLPLILNTTQETVPADIPYLHAREDLVEHWRKQLEPDTNFRVGICWQGNPNYSTHFLRATVAAKSMPLTNFLPIMETPGVTVYNLQKISGEDQINKLPKNANFITFDGDFDDTNGRFMDTAAIIKNLDLVISVDTSICHLAAGLGIPTWVPLPNPPDWRWMLNRSDTPWYPNMTLFRQPTPGDWKSVMTTITNELYKTIHRDTTSISAEVSIGELIDKMTILMIKSERITNSTKLENVRRELETLEATYANRIPHSLELEELIELLLDINKQLWEIEDLVREKEAHQEFDNEFVELARSVYITNDERCKVKKRINTLLGSRLVEEKSYAYM